MGRPPAVRNGLVFILGLALVLLIGHATCDDLTSFKLDQTLIATHQAVSDAADALISSLGWKKDEVKIAHIDTTDSKFGQTLVYEFDIEVGDQVIPLRLSEEVQMWNYLEELPGGSSDSLAVKTLPATLEKPQSQLLAAILAPFQLSGPVELWIQDAEQVRLAVPNDVETGVLKKVLLADGAVVTVEGAREVSLARPLQLPLPLPGISNDGGLAASLVALADRLRYASRAEAKPLLSLKIVGPTSLVASSPKNSDTSKNKLKVKRLAPGAIELVSRQQQQDQGLLGTFGSSLPVLSEGQDPWLWPLPSLNGSDSRLLNLEKILLSALGPSAYKKGSFKLLRAKVSAVTFVRVEFQLEKKLSEENFPPELWPEWKTRPSVQRPTGMLSELSHELQVEEGGVVVDESTHRKPVSYDDVLTLIASLKACGEQKDLHKGSSIHIDIVRRGLLKENVYIGNTLLSMYAKCGALEKAQEVFDELVDRNVVSWNALIAGYAQHGHGEKALLCFECMQASGFSPDACTFACILKACGIVGALDQGQVLHAQIVRACLLEKHIMVGNALVDMYAKCGALQKAQEVFDELVVPDLVSWTALIAGYAQHGHGEEALCHFDQMQVEGISPNAVTFACILKACGSIRALGKGQEIHAQIARQRLLERHTLISNALVDMYVKCGALDKAQEVLDELPIQNVISWTALIAGYTEHGHGERALSCYERMCTKGIIPNSVTFACVLRACGSIRALEKGQELHILIERGRFLEKDIMVANALMDMYMKCGALEKAQKVFDDLPFQNVVSWTTLIAGYADHGHGEKALRCFEMMQLKGLPPNEVTFACILKACGSIGAIGRGQDIHAQILREHFLEKHLIVANALVDMYSKCGALEKAQKVFDELLVRNIISWNGLISGYVQHGHNEEALSCFEQMQAGGFSPNVVTFACILKALGTLGALEKGREIHTQVVRDCLLEVDIVLVNALLDMYVKCGALETAHEAFNKLFVRDVVSWNTLTSGYAQHECGEEALSCFERMQIESFLPDLVTFASALKACGSSGAAYKGKRLHALVDSSMLLENDNTVGVGLLVLYANCGMLTEAQELFDKLPIRDVVSWSALMEGYAQLGKHEIVLILFEEMLREGLVLDPVSFTIVLNACSHGGLLDKGQMYFEIMTKGCGIIRTPEHHNCMVDLLGRAGQLDKASVVIEEMPLSANLLIWHTFLGACQKWADMKYGQWAFEHAVQLDEKEPSSYISIRNVYAAAGRQEDASTIEALRITKEAYSEE